MVPEINYTHIVIILKVKSPKKMLDFWPISLCNVIYKIVSKVLANRLKQILPWLISLTQSVFVPGQLITDNVLVAYETLRTMHYRKKGKRVVNELSRSWITRARLNKKLVHVRLFTNKPSLSFSFRLVW